MTTEVYIEISRVIGPVSLTGTPANQVRISVPRVIGPVALFSGVVANKVRIAIPRVVGSVELSGEPVAQCRVWANRVFGYVRLRATAEGTDWSNWGFPCPTIRGTPYEQDPGLERTEMSSGKTLQRQRFTQAYYSATLMFAFHRTRISELECRLVENAGKWFTMGLVTGANDSAAPKTHFVQVVGDVNYSDLHGSLVMVQMPVYFIPIPSYPS